MHSQARHWLPLAVLGIGLPWVAGAAVVPDASLGSAVTRSGLDFRIEGGAQRGGNLFHSFDRFDLISGESATFQGPGEIANILARVTGGASTIDGVVRSTIRGANLFLLNPDGVMFKSNARLELTGSFVVSTAERVDFADAGKFFARLGGSDVLSASPVRAFGFGVKPAAVTFQGSSLELQATGTGLHVLAGDILADASAFQVPSGGLTLFSAAGQETVPFDLTNPGAAYATARTAGFGAVTLQNGTSARLSSGRVVIRAGRLSLASGSTIDVTGQGDVRGGDVAVKAERVSLVDGAAINVLTRSVGAGGDLTIEAGALRVASQAALICQSMSASDAGRLTLRIDGALEVVGGGEIFTDAEGEGRGGALDLRAGALLIDGGQIRSESSDTGPAGPMQIAVRDTLRLAGGGFISGSTFGPGRGAEVAISAGRLEIDSAVPGSGIQVDVGSPIFSPEENEAATGRGGNLRVRAGEISVAGAGAISASTFGPGGSGALTLAATRSLVLSNGGLLVAGTQGAGDAGNVRVSAGRLLIDGRGTAVSVQTGIIAQSKERGDGRAGSIDVTASSLTMLGGAIIEATTGSENDAGSVNVTAQRILLDGRGAADVAGTGLPLATAISARADLSSSGNGGNVTVTASNSIVLRNRGEIEAATAGSGRGGSVAVRAGALTATGGSFGFPSGVLARGSETATGPAGDVAVRVGGDLVLEDGAEISSNNLGAGRAGSMQIAAGGAVRLSDGARLSVASRQSDAGSVSILDAQSITLEGGSRITASAGGNGGNISLVSRDLLYLSQSRLEAEAGAALTASGTSGIGGNIFIDPTYVILDRSQISANAAAGRGGNIEIVTDFFLPSETAITATGAQAGTVTIAAPELDLTAGLADLSGALFDASTQLRELCARRLGLDFSSFLVIGRGGLSLAPDDAQSDDPQTRRHPQRKSKR